VILLKALVIADAGFKPSINELVESHKIELVITLGDLLPIDLSGLETVPIPKIGVYGNHDTCKYMPDYNIINLHCTEFGLNGLTFTGFEGCVEYKKHSIEPMYSQKEAAKLINKLPRVDIFVTHCPPRGINDDDDIHQGWDALTKYIKHKKPKVLLHGHTYPTENNLVQQYRKTRIEYVREYRIVEL